MAVHIIIPARYASTRFPGKPLHLINGVPLIRHTVDAARRARRDAIRSEDILSIHVATDDDRIAAAAGGSSIMTRSDRGNGTERCWDAATRLDVSGDDWIINWQGDAPLTPLAALDALMQGIVLAGDENVVITPVFQAHPEHLGVGSVTVALGRSGRAIYFSRELLPTTLPRPVGHIGMYAYRVRSLEQYVGFGRGAAERAEDLEQLRWIEMGVPVNAVMVPVSKSPVELNNPSDAQALEEALP